MPKPFLKDDNFNFSFSGIKTHINLLVKKNKVSKKFIEDVSASFQRTILDIISQKILNKNKILNERNDEVKSISIVGGVSNNKYKKNLENIFEEKGINIYYPIKEMMSDNAAMIAWACLNNYDDQKENIFLDLIQG